MKVRRRIALALCSSKSPLSESERSFIQSVVYNTRGDILTFGSNSFLFSLGARKTRESDIENCVSVCIEIREHIQGIKFGVSYGLVSIDEKKDGSIKIEGPITKKVKHLESISAPGQISTDDTITKIYSRIFDIRHVKTKGKDVYNIFGFKGKPSRIRGLREAYGRMIGRDKEFNTLQNFILQTASDHGMIVGVVGEAGIGKTRITHELKTLIKMRGLRFYEGSFPYFGGSSYKGFKDIISSIASIAPSDPINVIDQKLRRIKSKYNLEDSDINFLVNLYSIIPVSETLKHLNEEQLRLGTFVAVKKLLFTIAESPLVIILEDMQNADELSVELANFLCEGIPDKKLLFFMNYRPEFKGKFEENVYFNRIKLERFDEAKAKELLTSLLDISNVPKNLLKLIIKKSAGNPLFIEELVRSLLDKGKIKVINNELQLSGDIKAEDIQPTVHGVISYRMEKLDPGTRKVLQWSAAAGDEINIKLIKSILTNPPPSTGGKRTPLPLGERQGEGYISKHIETLETRDFIVEKSIYPEEIYKFRHDLIREVAYESLSSSTKKNMHLKIGQYLENKFKKEIDEHVEEIANHYIVSSNHEKGFEYAFKAAEKLKKNYANEEAIKLYKASLELLPESKSNNSIRLQLYEAQIAICILASKKDLALSLLNECKKYATDKESSNFVIFSRMSGEVNWRFGFYKKAVDNLSESLKIAKKLLNKEELITTLNLLVSVHSMAGDMTNTRTYADELLSTISGKNRGIEANIYHRLGQLFFNSGIYSTAIQYYQKSIGIYEELEDLFQYATLNNHIGHAYSYIGNYQKSLHHLGISLKISHKIGSSVLIGNSHLGIANIQISIGNLKEGITEYKIVKDLFEKGLTSLDGVMIYHNIAWLYYFLGDYKIAKNHLEQSKIFCEAFPATFWIGVNTMLEGKIERNLGNYDVATLLINKARTIFEEIINSSHIVEAASELIDICYLTNRSDNLRNLLDELEQRSRNELSINAKEKAYIARIKAALLLNQELKARDCDKLFDIDKFDYENRFEAFAVSALYYGKIVKDIDAFNGFFSKAQLLFKDLVEKIPLETLETTKTQSRFKLYMDELISLKKMF
jgi:tetratricopeptide (TPR) repeat protein